VQVTYPSCPKRKGQEKKKELLDKAEATEETYMDNINDENVPSGPFKKLANIQLTCGITST
jgi:hypothetical protein